MRAESLKVYLCVKKPVIRIEDVSKRYTDSIGGIQNISFEINKGNITSVIGSSGSGKSTLLKCIYGTLRLDAGNILYKDLRVKGPDEQLIPGHPNMKMVSQDFNLNIYANVYDNVGAMISNKDLKSKDVSIRCVLSQLQIEHLERKRIIELSGGEQQRVAIARSLVNNTDVLLLDEPFSQIDTLLKAQLRRDLKMIVKERNINMVLVSHDPVDGLSMSDQVIILDRGKLIQMGSPAHIYENPKTAHIAKLLGQANVVEAKHSQLLNIPSDRDVVIYPEQILITDNLNDIPCKVIDLSFRGNVDDILIECRGLILSLLHNEVGKIKIGDNLRISVRKYTMI